MLKNLVNPLKLETGKPTARAPRLGPFSRTERSEPPINRNFPQFVNFILEVHILGFLFLEDVMEKILHLKIEDEDDADEANIRTNLK